MVNFNNLVRPSTHLKPAPPTPSATPPATMCLLNVRALKEKGFSCQDFIMSTNVDFLMITESWMKPQHLAPLIEACPPDYSYFNQPRLTRGGGLAVIYRNNFKCSQLSFGSFSSFESFSFLINGKSPLLCVLIYRPPNYNAKFIDEFSELLSLIMPQYDRVQILGDFNLHVCCPSESVFAADFIKLYESFNLLQSVTGPTHIKGHTLDLVLSFGFSLNNVVIREFPPSDHKAVIFQTLLPCPAPKPLSSSYSRVFNVNSASRFQQAFLAAPSISSQSQHSVDDLVGYFNSISTNILNKIAPFKTKYQKPNALHWLNDHTREIKQQCRRAERRWHKDKLDSSLNILRNCMATYQNAVKEARNLYFSKLISSQSHNPRVLFQTIDSAIGPPPSQPLEASPEKCEELLNHFITKIAVIRQQIIPESKVFGFCPAPPVILTTFNQLKPP